MEPRYLSGLRTLAAVSQITYRYFLCIQLTSLMLTGDTEYCYLWWYARLYTLVWFRISICSSKDLRDGLGPGFLRLPYMDVYVDQLYLSDSILK